MPNSKFELNCNALMFYWGFTFTVGEDVKRAYLQEVLKEKGKGKKTWLVCFQSAIKQTQIINVPLKPHIQITETGNWTLDAYYFSRKESFMKMLLFHDVRQKLSISITQLNFLNRVLIRHSSIYFPCSSANDDRRAEWSYSTFVSGSNFTATRGCALVKNSPRTFVRWHMSFRQLLLLTGLCANAFQGSPEPCKSFQVFMFLLKRYPAALILKKKKEKRITFFFTSPVSLNCSSSWPEESANGSSSWSV